MNDKDKSVNLNTSNSSNDNSSINNVQDDMYASFEHHENTIDNANLQNGLNNQTPVNTTNNINNVNNVNSVNDVVNANNATNTNSNNQHNDHYLEEHTVVTRSSKASKFVLYGFYLLFLIIGVAVFMMIRADRYEFYLVKDEVNISHGSSYQVELTPKNLRYFKYSNYNYEVEDEDIATVDEFGYVTAVGVGTTNLKISLSPGLTSKKMRINTENIDIDTISLLLYIDDEYREISEINMHTNQTYTLKAIANNRHDLSVNVDYSSSNTNVAIVDEYGNVTALSKGTVTITGARDDITGSVVIIVTEDESFDDSPYDIDDGSSGSAKVTGVSLNSTSLSMRVDESRELVATVLPSNADNKGITWSSSDTSVVTVDNNGVVESIKEGTATITVKTKDGGKEAKCQVTVSKDAPATVDVSSISLNKSSLPLKVDESESLRVKIEPSNATDTTVLWSSSNTSVATVSASGLVTAKSPGTATITVKSADGKKEARCQVTVQENVVAVSSVSLNKSSIPLKVNGSKRLVATVLPSNATDTSVSWSSSNTSVATVSSSGVVTGKSAGTATITVKTTSGSKTATCVVTVSSEVQATVAVTKVTLNDKTLDLYEKEHDSLEAIITPDNATNQELVWSSDKESVATVKDGVVKGISAGTAVITVKNPDSGKQDTCTVTVKKKEVEPTKVTLNKTTLPLYEKEHESLEETVLPTNATNKSVKWSSSNESIATVSSSGVVTGVKAGTAVITVKTVSGAKTATCTVTVKEKTIKVTKIILNETNLPLEVGDTASLEATVEPSNATNKELEWSSNKESVATVNKRGKVTAIAKGTATITVKNPKSGKTATCKVTVKDKKVAVTGVKLNKTAKTLKKGGTFQLTATVLPDNATDQSVTWDSDNKSVAKVKDGLVTALSEGVANIIVKTKDNGKTATCKITVKSETTTVAVTGVKIEVNSPYKMKVGDESTLSAKVSPTNATNQALTWTSSDESKVKVVNKETGKIKAVAAGEATITVKTNDGGKTDTIQVQVAKEEKAPDGTQFTSSNIVLSPLKLTIDRNSTKSFKITIKNAGVMLTVSSSNNNVAKVTTSSEDCNSNLECLFDAEPNKSAKTAEFEVKGIASGTAYINIKIDDAQSYDGEAITGTGKVGILVK